MCESKKSDSSPYLEISLKNFEEYELFAPSIMEQTVSPVGKIFIPEPVFVLNGLDEKRLYRISIRFDLISHKNYKYQENVWVESRASLTSTENNIIHHPDGYQLGEDLNGEEIKFRIKLTNKFYRNFPDNMVHLSTQGKYQPVLIVSPMAKDGNGLVQMDGIPQEFIFECLKFMSVTKFRNKHVQMVKGSLNSFSSLETRLRKKEEVLNVGSALLEHQQLIQRHALPFYNSGVSDIHFCHTPNGTSVSGSVTTISLASSPSLDAEKSNGNIPNENYNHQYPFQQAQPNTSIMSYDPRNIYQSPHNSYQEVTSYPNAFYSTLYHQNSMHFQQGNPQQPNHPNQIYYPNASGRNY